MNNRISLDFNMESYYLYHLSSTDISTCHTVGGTITQTIKHIGQNKHHKSTLEIMCQMVN